MNANKSIMNFQNVRLAPVIQMAPRIINVMWKMDNVIVTIIILLARIVTNVQKITGISPNVKPVCATKKLLKVKNVMKQLDNVLVALMFKVSDVLNANLDITDFPTAKIANVILLLPLELLVEKIMVNVIVNQQLLVINVNSVNLVIGNTPNVLIVTVIWRALKITIVIRIMEYVFARNVKMEKW